MNQTPRKRYTPEFKAQAVNLLAIGRPVAELAEELCVSPNLLYSWKSSSQSARVGSEGGRAVAKNAVADDPRALRREIALLRQENDILKKPRSSSAPDPNPTLRNDRAHPQIHRAS